MLDKFNNIEHLYGEVLIDGKSLGNCFYVFEYNPYDTQSMYITLYDPPNGMPSGPESPPVKVVTEFQWGFYEMGLHEELIGSKWSGKGNQCHAPVLSFLKKQHLRIKDVKDVSSKISITYLFPLTSITDVKSGYMMHSSFGLIRGDYDHEKQVIKPFEDKIELVYANLKITIGDEFDFQETKHNIYPQHHIVRKSFLSVETGLNEQENVDDKVAGIDHQISCIFNIISLIEYNWIDWHTRKYFAAKSTSEDEEIVEYYRNVKPPTSKYRPYYNEFPERRRTLQMLLERYEKLDPDKQKLVDRTIQNFKIANCSQTLDTKLIHWHSCLDFFIKALGVNENSFSKRLVKAFDEQNLEIDDLLPEKELKEIRKGIQKEMKVNDFDFAELRNKYIHEGFDSLVGRYHEVIEHHRTMRALAERLLLNYMGVDYRDTSLGRYCVH